MVYIIYVMRIIPTERPFSHASLLVLKEMNDSAMKRLYISHKPVDPRIELATHFPP